MSCCDSFHKETITLLFVLEGLVVIYGKILQKTLTLLPMEINVYDVTWEKMKYRQ